MIARQQGDETLVIIDRDHVRNMRTLMPGGGLPRTEMRFYFSESGTLLNVTPAGARGAGVDRLADAARRAAEKLSREKKARDPEAALL